MEGKADEPFDLTVEGWLAKRTGDAPDSGAPKRVASLVKAFFGTTLEDEPAIGKLQYQLLAALAGTLADAKSEGAARAVLLVHEFHTDTTRDEIHRQDDADLGAFMARLGGGSVERSYDVDPHAKKHCRSFGDQALLLQARDLGEADLRRRL